MELITGSSPLNGIAGGIGVFAILRHIPTIKTQKLSRDINSHEHATNFMSEFFTEWNGSDPRLTETTFSKSEGWELCELFKRFYILRETADMYHNSSAHVSKSIL